MLSYGVRRQASLHRMAYAITGLTDSTDEQFTIDDLGNRTKVNLRDTTDVNYAVDDLTNHYDSVGDANLTYDAAERKIKN